MTRVKIKCLKGWVQTTNENGLLMICLRPNCNKVDWFGRKEFLAKITLCLSWKTSHGLSPQLWHTFMHTQHIIYMEWNGTKSWAQKCVIWKMDMWHKWIAWNARYKVVNLSFGLNQTQKIMNTSHMNHLWGIWVGKTSKKSSDKKLIFSLLDNFSNFEVCTTSPWSMHFWILDNEYKL